MAEREALSFNEKMIDEFRSNGGRLGAFGDGPVLLLTTTGARSGQPRTAPMMYLADQNDPQRVYVFASAAGADTHPAWYHNLVANPKVHVEIGTDTLDATAEALEEPRRTEIFREQAARFAGFGEYEQKTTRVIPVVALDLER